MAEDTGKPILEPTPSEYTNEWYRQQFQKLNYHWQLSMTRESEMEQQIRFLRKQCKELSDQRSRDMAEIGRLNERMDELLKRLDEAAKVVAELKKKVK